jgi:hypothetical protein
MPTRTIQVLMKVTPHTERGLVDTHEPKHLPTWSLEIKVRIGHIELLDAEGEKILRT